tara:strand:+ start:362 stop:1306 length:945 start_codon:yes stop_codon:yes gene_type:complete
MIGLDSKIYVAGHKGLVGSSILRKLKANGYKNIIYADSKKLDLTNQNHVFNFLKKKKPSFIFIAAAKVGGIYANNRYKAEFIQKNLTIQTNLIHSAYLNKINDLIFLGSSCVYPKKCKQPIKENYLLTGPLEETNDAYAIAKIAGIKMCQSYNNQYKTRYKCLMPTNTYGPNDNYHGLNSHFFPALIKKIHEIKLKNKKNITIWGNGRARRELIFVDDLAEACVYFMNKKVNHNLINIGTGEDQTIKQYTEKLLKILIPDRKVKIKFDLSKPNGTPRKLLDVSLAKKYGWVAKTNFKNSIIETYNSYLDQSYNK